MSMEHLVEWELAREIEVPGENLSQCHIPHDLTWARTRAAAVGTRRLTAWAMARPIFALLSCTVPPSYSPRNTCSETSVHTTSTEGGILHSRRCENVESYKLVKISGEIRAFIFMVDGYAARGRNVYRETQKKGFARANRRRLTLNEKRIICVYWNWKYQIPETSVTIFHSSLRLLFKTFFSLMNI
jgi:hypothetical protein